MMIKLTTAFVASAALLSTAAQALQCSLQTFKSNIVSVEAYSASDLANKYVEPNGPGSWADIILTEDHHQDIRDAHRYLSMRHNGADCSQISKAQYNTCNAEYVDYAAGNSCAQVLSKSHRIGWSTGKALDIAESAPNQPVHFRASLAPSLQNWWAGIVGTCATQTFDAPDRPYRSLTFVANNIHTWTTVVVKLDQPDNLFGESLLCNYSDELSPSTDHIQAYNDNTIWVFKNLKFNPILYSPPNIQQSH